MLLKYIQALAECGIAIDTETHRFQPGLKAPPIVVASASWFEPGPTIKGTLLSKDEIVKLFIELLEDETRVITGANICMFDLLVIAREYAKRGTDLMPSIYKALDQGRIYDIQLAQALHDIANGHLGIDPRTNSNIINPETGRRGRYSLPYCVDILLDRRDAKANAKFKENYADLENVPIELWPPEAVQYPIDDTNNTHESALAQTGHVSRQSVTHDWGKDGACKDCGSTRISATCFVRRPIRNLHDLANQVYTAHAMHMGAARGFRVNQKSVDIVENYALKKRNSTIGPFVAAQIIREEDGTVNEAVLKRMVAEAYGAKEPCPICKGTGKVPSPEAKSLRCPDCKGRCQPWKAGGQIKDPTVSSCDTCNTTGRVPHPNPKMIGCVDFDEAGEKVKSCDGTGLRLTEDVPRTDKDGVGKGKDPCHESGDDFLMSYGDFLEDAKVLKDYVPYLREARVQNDDGSYRDIPLTLSPNPILETGRVSYNGYIQLFPRKPGFWEDGVYIPSIRECIEARPGFVLASIDYDSGELVTHAQSLLWLTGHSKLAEALVTGAKVHNMLGASMIGLTYAEFNKRVKDRICKNARQAAKPGNFGFPGGMGPVKMVHQQRIQGPDTPHPNGPNWIMGEDRQPIRGYKGLRFCILMDDAPACGIEKTREWRDHKISPTCTACIECAVRLKKLWLQQWPENAEYFRYINQCIDFGQEITGEMLDRWDWLKEVYIPGTQLAPAEIMQHHSGRIRGGLDYCAAANGFFQGLLGDLAKAAVRRISRECYDKTYKIPELAHANSHKSAYAGIQSPLYGSHIIAFQHDEVIPELIESNAHDAAMRISEVMVEEMMYYCPDLVPAAKAPPALMKVWNKNAAPLFNSEGKLIPWVDVN
jgi:hypothetical protein